MPGLRWRLLHLLAMSTMAITQPLLSILGDNPTFFTAHGSSAAQVIWFALVITLLPAVVLGGIETAAHVASPRAGARVHVALMAALGFLFLIQVVDVLPGPWVVAALVAGGLSIAVVQLYRRHPPVRTVVSILALTPVLFLGLFLFVSPASSVIFPDEVAAVEIDDLLDQTDLDAAIDGADTGAAPSLDEQVNTRFPPIYLLVLDELPIASLLDESGEIDAARWPNFARLAATSHLFSNATTVGFTTERAVPAMLAGTYETQDAPVYSLYPQNLFTLLGDIYDTSSSDPLVDLCPPSVCDGEPPQAMVDLLASDVDTTTPPVTLPEAAADSTDTSDTGSSSFRLLLDDAAIVFGHLATPEGLDLALPSIGAGWGNFGGDLGASDPAAGAGPTAVAPEESPGPTPPIAIGAAIDAAEPDSDSDSDTVNQANAEYLASLRTADSRVADFRTEVAGISPSAVPRLHYLHVLLPHVPWRLHANGETYADISLPGYFSSWDDDIVTAHAGQQRHLLQLQFVDALLGEYLDQLEDQEIFDEATVIVTADHGVSFVPGQRSRGVGERNLGGIAGVPIFYKLPDQTEPERHIKPVETVDLVPTIAAQLQLEPPWPVDGHDLFGPEIDRDRAIWHPFSSDIVEPFPPQIAAVTADLIATFGNGTEGNLYALAGLAELIGEPIPDSIGPPTSYCWTEDLPTAIPDRSGSIGYLHARMATSRAGAIEFALVVDGVLTGTSRTIDDDQGHLVYALGDPTYWVGATTADIALYEIDDGRLLPIARC